MAEIWAHRLKKAALALLYIMIYLVMMYIFSIEVTALEEDLENYSGIITILASVAALSIYGVLLYLRKLDVRNYIRIKRVTLLDIVLAFTLSTGFRLLTGAYFIWADNVPVLKESIENAQQSYNFNTMTNFCIVTIVLSVVVIAPVFEELLFRGMVQKELSDIMPEYCAIIIQGVMFGIAHGVLAQSIFAAAYGVVLGVIYGRTKNIAVVILAHMFFNMSSVLEIKSEDMLVRMVLSGLAMTVASIFIFFYVYRKKSLPAEAENVSGGNGNG